MRPEPAARGTSSLHIRDFTNGRGSDVDGPIRHAKPDRRTHTREVPHTRAVPHTPDIHQPQLAAAPDEHVWTVEAEGLSLFQLMISSTLVACGTGGPADYSAATSTK
jgi:hypothetical protein